MGPLCSWGLWATAQHAHVLRQLCIHVLHCRHICSGAYDSLVNCSLLSIYGDYASNVV